MKKFLRVASMLLIFITLLSSCKHQSAAGSGSGGSNKTTATSEGGGTSFADAVVIDADNESTGVDAEYAWLKSHYPGYRLIKQSLVTHEGKPYDVMNIKTAGGEKKDVYFDISAFFGKF
jgi:hypothetical protein